MYARVQRQCEKKTRILFYGMYVRTCVCIYARVYVCMYVCMYVCIAESLFG